MKDYEQCPDCKGTSIEQEVGIDGSTYLKCFDCKIGFNIYEEELENA